MVLSDSVKKPQILRAQDSGKFNIKSITEPVGYSMRVYYSIIKYTHVHPPFKKSGYGPANISIDSFTEKYTKSDYSIKFIEGKGKNSLNVKFTTLKADELHLKWLCY